MSTTKAAIGGTTGWFKSSRSNGNQSCVEVRFTDEAVLIRDSKYLRNPANDPAAQPVITIPSNSWPVFLGSALSEPATVRPDLPSIESHPSGGATLRATDGTALTYTAAEWAAFVAGVRAGEFVAAAPDAYASMGFLQ